MSNKKKLVDLFQSKGLLFPSTDKQVEEFEKHNLGDEETPQDWDNPEAILKRGIQKLRDIKVEDVTLNNDIEELRMVARKGSALPQHVIDKMKANHKKNDK